MDDSSSVGCIDEQRLQQVVRLQKILSESLINIGKLRNVAASSGIPISCNLRPTIWKLLLSYLPLDTSLWDIELASKRADYARICNRFCGLSFSHQLQTTTTSSSTDSFHDFLADDHPLSDAKNSIWRVMFEDRGLLNEIQTDTARTHPQIAFFIDEKYYDEIQQRLQRILFIFAKLHPEIKYVQGMNDICGTVFYVFCRDEWHNAGADWRDQAEADAYYCFTEIVCDNKEIYISSMDFSSEGLLGRFTLLEDLLQRHSPNAFEVLKSQGLDVSFFGLRWLTTLLSREFDLTDCILLWDALFIDTDRVEFLSYVCCAMVSIVEAQLMQGDFCFNLQLLQRFPPCEIAMLIKTATAFRLYDWTQRMPGIEGSSDEGEENGVNADGSVKQKVWFDLDNEMHFWTEFMGGIMRPPHAIKLDPDSEGNSINYNVGRRHSETAAPKSAEEAQPSQSHGSEFLGVSQSTSTIPAIESLLVSSVAIAKQRITELSDVARPKLLAGADVLRARVSSMFNIPIPTISSGTQPQLGAAADDKSNALFQLNPT